MTAAIPISKRIDRRLDERSDALTGLTRWLESARRDLQLEALALADPSGCLVVGAGPAQQCEELAALAPLVTAAGNGDGNQLISAFSVGSAWLCAPQPELPTVEWVAVANGCLRILGWSQAA